MERHYALRCRGHLDPELIEDCPYPACEALTKTERYQQGGMFMSRMEPFLHRRASNQINLVRPADYRSQDCYVRWTKTSLLSLVHKTVSPAFTTRLVAR